MTALAHYLISTGHTVSGSDRARSAASERLVLAGASIAYDHSGANVDGSELVVVSDAISTDNVEIEAARSRNIPLLRRAECLDVLVRDRLSFMVAGSHGKSTTAAMIACVLDASGLDPSFVLGADVPCLGDARARAGVGPHAVVEACEAFRNLENFNPGIAVVTNVDDEHVNHYVSQGALDTAFADYVNRASIAIVSGEDPGVARIRPYLGRVTTFGLAQECDISGDAEPAPFSIRIRGDFAGCISLPIPGDHMRRNSLAAIAACLTIDLSFSAISDGLARFTGVARRWQEVGAAAGVRIVDDYAHHPAEIRAGLMTARAVAPDARLVAVFQPLLGSRVQRLHDSFAESLSHADLVLLLDLDTGGEVGFSVTSESIAEGLRRRGTAVHMRGSPDDLIEYAGHDLTTGDIVLVMGGRGMDGVAKRLNARLATQAAPPVQVKPRSWMSRFGDRLRAPTTVVDLFRRAVRADPAKAALNHPGGNFSYAWLDTASDAVAAGLAERGLAGCVVGVSLPHSVELVVAMLGVMKAGATYLPLDVALPAARANFMMERSSAAAYIAREALQSTCPHLRIEELRLGMQEVPRGPRANDRAYICFTSGSTGYPKGIPIHHAALFALLGDIVPRFGIGTRSRTAFNTSISFDVSLAELCSTLASGGALVVGATRPMVGDKLAEFLERQSITHLCVTPTVLASAKPRKLPSLGTIIVCGEVCSPTLVEDWAADRQFFNVYGPTEATIYATAAQCRPEKEVTIGTALKHLCAHVLDDAQAPVRDGEVGELCLSGVGLSEGYIAQPEETGRRFVQSVMGRVYRTGDMVRRSPGGALSYVGRVDDQVKILGNRLELEEIERTAMRQDGVSDAAVCVTQSEPKALVCFILPDSGSHFDELAFTEQLATWLPESAIPAHIVQVANMPMTASGKKDRRRLLAEHSSRVVTWANHFHGPSTEVEIRVAALWRKALKLDRDVGMFDRFALLGGDSLTALQLVIAIEGEFQITVLPGYFGRLTTVPKMAAPLADLLWHRDEDRSFPAIGFRDSRIFRQMVDLCGHWPGHRSAPNSLISALGALSPEHSLFLCGQMEEEFVALARWLPATFRIHAMRSGHMAIDHGPASLRQLTAHYVEEIEALDPLGNLVFVGVCQGGVIAQMVAETFLRQGRRVPLLVLVEPMQPRPYAGQVAVICGDSSFRNPFRSGGVGHGPFAAAFPSGYTIDLVESSHGAECLEPAVRTLAQHVVGRLNTVVPSHAGSI